MGQRSKIAACSHAALRRNHRCDAAIEQIAQPLGNERPDSRKSSGQNVRADQHHGANFGAAKRIADATRMRSDHVALQLLKLFRRYADIGQESDSGVDGVNGRLAGREFLDNHARALHSRDGVGCNFDGRVVSGDLVDFVERQTRTV